MTTEEKPKLSSIRRVGRVVAWITGLFLILSGLGFLFGPGLGSKLMGLGSLGAGALTLPALVDLLRRHVSFLRFFWAPPIAALAVFILGVSFGASMSPTTHEGASPASSEEATAKRQADMAEIERLLTEPSDATVREAEAILRRYRRDTRDGGELHPLLEQVEAARATLKARGDAGRYVERVAEMTPKVDAIYTKRAEAFLTIMANLETISDASTLVQEGQKFSGDPEAMAAANALRGALAAKQRSAFPAMRASYGRITSDRLWEADTEVVVQGGNNRTMRLISVAFAANRNIAQVHRDIGDTLRRLRFSRAQYEWYRGGEGSYYTLETPQDGVVGVWSGGTFEPVPEIAPGA